MRFIRIAFVIALIVSSFVFPVISVNHAAAAGEPTVGFDNISDYVNTLPTISGTASDDSAVDKVRIQIKNNDDSTYWDGSAWQAATWAVETVDSTGHAGHGYNSLAFDDDGNPVISYPSGWPNYGLKFTRWNGASWDIEIVDSNGDVGEYNAFAFDNSGNPAISYYDGTNGDLKFTRWNGASWDIEIIDSDGDVGKYNAFAFDDSGNPAISYFDDSNDDLKFARWNGASWDIEIVDSDGDVGECSSLAFDDTGKPAIGYRDFTDYDLKLARWNGSNWGIEKIYDSLPEWISLVFNDAGNPALSFSADSKLNYVWWDGGSWNKEEIITNASIVPGASSLALDHFDNPAISYYNYSNDYLMYANREGDDNWNTEAVDLHPFVGRYNSLEFDTDSNPVISYYDGTNYDLKYARLINGVWLDATGTETWTYAIPVLEEETYTITAKAIDNVGNTGIASETFVYDATNPVIQVTSPNGGESWEPGTAHDITWTASDANIADNPITIEYYNGSSWVEVTSGEDNDGSYSWTVADANTTSAKIRITVEDKAGNSASDESDSTLTIYEAPAAPLNPKCEGQTNPSNVSDVTPELGWTFSDPDVGDSQSAYQILVASDTAWLDLDIGDLWDSEKVASTSTQDIAYDSEWYLGLSWGDTVYWKVKTWDSSDNEGPYCANQSFTMASGPVAPTSPLCEGQTFPTSVSDSTPEFGWTFASTDNGYTQAGYRILVASSLANLTANNGDMWDSNVMVSAASSDISYLGSALVTGQTYYWKVMVWDLGAGESPYCTAQSFTMADSVSDVPDGGGGGSEPGGGDELSWDDLGISLGDFGTDEFQWNSFDMKNVGSSGGELKNSNSAVDIDIPAGAVTSDTPFYLMTGSINEAVVNPPGYKFCETCFVVVTTGTLSEKATITVKYTDDDVEAAGGDPSKLALIRCGLTADDWVVVPTTVDTENKTLTAETDQFSMWAVVVRTGGTNVGLILGIVLPCIALAGFAAWYYLIRKRKIIAS